MKTNYNLLYDCVKELAETESEIEDITNLIEMIRDNARDIISKIYKESNQEEEIKKLIAKVEELDKTIRGK